MTILEVEGLRAGYDDVQVLHGVDLEVGDGEVVVVLGANGSGKTTTLRALSGTISRRGSVRFAGHDLVNLRPEQIVRRGIAHVPQGRGTFASLSVEDNLRAGASIRRGAGLASDLDRWFTTFPVLQQRRHQKAGTLSGGEQQMLATARAMMSRPQLLLLDEPSLGLAPKVTEALFTCLGELNLQLGTSVVLVEQNAHLALQLAHRAYLLETGRIVATGTAADLQGDASIRRAYLGG